jgi:hypothetical protein
MRQNPLGDALAFLVATDKLLFTVVFWLLLLGSAAIAGLAWRADPAQRNRGIADTRSGYASRRRAWRVNGDQPLAGALQRTGRMALDLYVLGRLAADLPD